MKLALQLLMVLHGAVHLLGFFAAFGGAGARRFQRPLGRTAGALWGLAGLAFFAAAALWRFAPGVWWAAALPAVLLSQGLILRWWADAKAGTVANAVLLVPVALALVALRPDGFGALYRADVRSFAAAPRAPPARVTEEELAPLPPPLQRYLRRAGAVGRPHVQSFRARFRGTLRNGADAGWMEISAQQHDFLAPAPARLFLMQASRWGVPFEAYHRFADGGATMRVRLASVVELINGRGPELTRSETVTLFNDLCLLAPAALLDADVGWEPVDARTVRGTFAHAGNRVTAQLKFDAQGDLVEFRSNDRSQSADGKVFRQLPWTTPLSEYRDFGPARVAARGDAVWEEPGGAFVYGRFELVELAYNEAP